MGGEKATETTDEQGSAGSGSRRTFLRAVGAVSAIAGVGELAGAQETTQNDGDQTTTAGDDATAIVLGGHVSGWLGLAPDSIANEPNPTLRLRPGQQYRVVWINLDGARHEWLLKGDEGVVARTEAAERVGAARSTTFEATESLAEYLCEYHPEQMRGAVELGEGFRTPEEDDPESNETTATEGEVVDVAVGPEGDYLRFVPEAVEISVGDTVRWTAESEGHNVSAKPEAATQVELPEGAEPFATYEGNRSFMVMEVGETFEHTFTVPGEYVYVCAPHADQGMVGRVVVTE